MIAGFSEHLDVQFHGTYSPDETSQEYLKNNINSAQKSVEFARAELARLDEIKADLERGIKSVEEKYIPTLEARLKELDNYPYEKYLVINGDWDYDVKVIKVPQGANVGNAHDVRLRGEDGYWSVVLTHFDTLDDFVIKRKYFGKKTAKYANRDETYQYDDIENRDDYTKRAVGIVLDAAKKYGVPDEHVLDLSDNEFMYEVLEARKAKQEAKL